MAGLGGSSGGPFYIAGWGGNGGGKGTRKLNFKSMLPKADFFFLYNIVNWHFCSFVVRILIGFNNKNREPDIGVNASRSEETSYSHFSPH